MYVLNRKDRLMLRGKDILNWKVKFVNSVYPPFTYMACHGILAVRCPISHAIDQ